MDEFEFIITDRIEAEDYLFGLNLAVVEYHRKARTSFATAERDYWLAIAHRVTRQATRLEEALDPTPEPPETSRDEDLVTA